ncbi:MAG: sigma-54-dependent Fis family transcriptional regulator [Polyangiaceae bacterium]|nr:sigma-54-dependent Fis family transcriptional regulator [Polyangiaceae bacterium]
MLTGMTALRILLVEDDPSGRELASFNLKRAGYEVDAVERGEDALAAFSLERHAMVITDLRLPGIDGLEVLRGIRERAPGIPVLMITAYGSVDTAVEAMKRGAYDFIGKPFHREHLLLTVRRALDNAQLEQKVRELQARASGVERPIVGVSSSMRRVFDIVDRVAQSNASILITGETGTGKELVARRLHARSFRSEKPFVAVNCAAIPAELLEAELFGHVKGAFTGATRARLGRFRQAEGGTVFLDEIFEMPASLQSKLLRVLQERVVDVLGQDAPEPVDVRVVAATNQDLAARVREGQLREDLFYRLNVVEIRVPPLRERAEDIEPLVRHFVELFAEGRELGIPDELVRVLRERAWPGNVRELRNACERAVLLCRADALSIDDLPAAHLAAPAASSALSPGEWPPLPDGGLSLVDLEKSVIMRVLALKGGNVSQAAAYLRVPRHILAYRLAKYGLQRHPSS